jgi:hypothetical protein
MAEHSESENGAASVACGAFDKEDLALSGTVRYITNIKSSHIRPRMIQVGFLA